MSNAPEIIITNGEIHGVLFTDENGEKNTYCSDIINPKYDQNGTEDGSGAVPCRVCERHLESARRIEKLAQNSAYERAFMPAETMSTREYNIKIADMAVSYANMSGLSFTQAWDEIKGKIEE